MAINHYKQTEYTAVCDRCESTEFIHDIDGKWRGNDTPSKYFLRQGWSDKTGVTLCPECVKESEENEHI